MIEALWPGLAAAAAAGAFYGGFSD